MQVPASNLHPNLLPRFVRNSRTEIDEVLAEPIFRSPGTKCVPQKIKFLMFVSPSPIIILAIDDLRLLRMKFQSALLQTRSYGCPDFLGFLLCPAMHDGVSSPGESHPEALSEPYLNLSAHAARVIEPRSTPRCQRAHN